MEYRTPSSKTSSEQLDSALMGSTEGSAPYTPWCRGWSDAKSENIPAVPCNGCSTVVADDSLPPKHLMRGKGILPLGVSLLRDPYQDTHTCINRLGMKS